MSFAIPDLELNFNNVRNELPWELFDVINDTINKMSVVCPVCYWQSFYQQ